MPSISIADRIYAAIHYLQSRANGETKKYIDENIKYNNEDLYKTIEDIIKRTNDNGT